MNRQLLLIILSWLSDNGVKILQTFIAPLAVPFGVALILSNELYRTMNLVGVDNTIAMICAVATAIGIEATGGLACFQFIEQWVRKAWGKMALAGAGVIIYVAMVLWGIYLIPEARAIIFMPIVGLTIACYLCYGIYLVSREADQRLVRNANVSVDVIKARTEQIKQQAKLERVKNKSVQPSILPSIRPVDNGQVTMDGQRIFDWLNKNGSASARKIAIELKVSPTTASKWLKRWKQ